MKISKYSALSKMQLLASVISDKDIATERKLKLHCTEDELVFTSDTVAVCEITKLDKDEFIDDITVNLYQLFNIIDCSDEFIDLEVIDDKLYVRSFHNQEIDEYEFESVLPSIENGQISFPEMDEDLFIERLNFNALQLSSLKSEFHNYESDGGFFIESRNGKLSFYGEDCGVDIKVVIKEFDTLVLENDFIKYIPFKLMELIFGSAGVGYSEMAIDIYNDFIHVCTDAMEIAFLDIEPVESFPRDRFDNEYVNIDNDGFIVEVEKFLGVLDLMDRVNKSNDIPDFDMVVGNDRMKITAYQNKFGVSSSAEIGLRTLMDDELKMKVDAGLLFSLLKVTGRELIRLYPINDKLLIEYDNAVIDKKVVIDFTKWLGEKY